MLIRSTLFSLFLFICLLPAQSRAQISDSFSPADASGQTESSHVRVEASSSSFNVQPGQKIRVGVTQYIDPHWHTYWKNPGDSGLATSVEWLAPKNISAGDLQWPVPEKIPFGPLTNYGYSEEVTLYQELTLPDTLPRGNFDLQGQVDLLVCKEICIPETHRISLPLMRGGKNSPQENSQTEPQGNSGGNLEESLNLPALQGTIAQTGDTIVIPLSLNELPADFRTVMSDGLSLFPESWGFVVNSAETVASVQNGYLNIRQKKGSRSIEEAVGEYFILAPDTEENRQNAVRIQVTGTGPQTSAITSSSSLFETSDGEGITSGESNVPSAGDVETTGETMTNDFLQAMLFALLGGVILNLMPCVFPVLSLKALSLAHMKEKDKYAVRFYGLAYTAGILLTFALIGGTLVFLKSLGSEIGWGFQLQTPVVVLFLAYLVFLVGLNLLGIFELQGRFTGHGQRLTQGEGLKPAFFTGVLAVLVATPCVAPFMSVALGYALTQPAGIAFLVFMALGLGLALPYLILCFVPASRNLLPAPGPWMETFRQLLSFPMFLTAAWLLWVVTRQGGNLLLLSALCGFVLTGFVFWLLQRKPKGRIGSGFKYVFLAASIAFILGTFVQAATLAMTTTDVPATSGNDSVQPLSPEAYSPGRLESLLSGDTQRAVFVNMTAAWCITCQVNERVALRNNNVREMFTERNIAYLKGDWTNRDADITAYLKSFERGGVPLYVFYPPAENIGLQRPDPIVLPQILTPGIVTDALNTGI